MRHSEELAFLARETGWTLEYIGESPIEKYFALLAELSFQKAQDDYRSAHNSALIVSALVSTKQHRVMPTDIIGSPPGRATNKEEDIWLLARKASIRIPKL